MRQRIYLDHGDAYGNLGDAAMLLNAVRRIRAAAGAVEFVLPHQPGAPMPAVDGAAAIEPPRLALRDTRLAIFRAARLRTALERLSPGLTWRLAGRLLYRTRGAIAGGRAWRGLILALQECRAVYCIGAANLNDFARIDLLAKCLLVEQAAAMGLPVILSSQAVGPLATPWMQRAVVACVGRSAHFSLRDGGPSADLLARLGVDRARLQSVGDEALSLPPGAEAEACAYLAAGGHDPEQPFYILHFRATDYTGDTARHYPTLAQALDECASPLPFLFLPMSDWQHSGRDADCGRAIRALMGRPERLRVLTPPADPGLARRVVELSRGVVALSYHVLVFALAALRPMVILSSGEYYRAKAVGFHAWLGDETALADLERSDAAALRAALDGLTAAPGQRERRAVALAEARRRAEANNDAPIAALQRALAARP